MGGAGVVTGVMVVVFLAGCARPLQPAGIGDSPAHHYALGMKLLGTNEPGPAQEAFDRALALAPNDAPALEGLGRVALARRDPERAQTLFMKAVSSDAKYVPAHLGLARAYAMKGEHDGARREAETARRLDPKNPQVPLVLGEVLLQAFDFERAESSFARALELDPRSLEARRAWDRSVKIRQAAPGTLVGKRIALADPVKRGELAALLATELGVESYLRKRRPEIFDASFRPPGHSVATVERPGPSDIAGHWARNAIELAIRLDLMEAFPDGMFRPDEPVTRAALASMLEQVLAVVANDPTIKTRHVGQPSPFADVRGDHFAFNAIMVATTRGLMEAERPSGAFRLTTPVSGPEALLAMRKLAELF